MHRRKKDRGEFRGNDRGEVSGAVGGAENANRPEVIRAVGSSETLGRSSYFALETTKNLQLAVTPLPSLTWTSYLPRALIG